MADNFVISATCRSDDGRISIDFDAVDWFKNALDERILNLAYEGWCSGEAADLVAEHFQDGVTADLFNYLSLIHKYRRSSMAATPEVGFECSVNKTQALAWLRTHGLDLLTLIEEETN